MSTQRNKLDKIDRTCKAVKFLSFLLWTVRLLGSQAGIGFCVHSEWLLVAANTLEDTLQLLNGVVGLGRSAKVRLGHHHKRRYL